jgi:hypothetical protein
MSKIPAEHDETDAINALINSKLSFSSEISAINFWFVSSGGRFRIMPNYTEAFLNTHTAHIQYVDIYPNAIRVTNATWNSSTQTWDFTNKDYT